MAKRKKRLRWRSAFLRVLGETANVRQAAREAGIDHRSAYDLRKRRPAFARAWARVLRIADARAEQAKDQPLHHPVPPGGPPPRGKLGEELVVRRSKRCGTQLVKAGPGRWSGKAEREFLAELARTACVQSAADACGFSTTALYNRRAAYPDFAAKWAATEALAKERLPGLLVAASIASFDPEVAAEGLPPVNVDQAIRIAQLKCGGGEKGGRRRAPAARREPSIEEVRDEVIRRIAALRRRQQKNDPKLPPLDGEGRGGVE